MERRMHNRRRVQRSLTAPETSDTTHEAEKPLYIYSFHHTDDWTLVTRDQSFVDCLLRLYFSWVHPFYCFFAETGFAWSRM